MRYAVIIFFLLFLSSFAFSQKVHNKTEKVKITQTCIAFLNWYKQQESKLETSTIIKGFNSGTVKKDSILSVDMNAVETYLANFKAGGYVSTTFINHLRTIYKNVSDTLAAHPVKDYFGPVPDLESDVIFGFAKDEIFNHIKKARIIHFMRVYNKALISLRLSYTTELVFTLTRKTAHWEIDYIGFNGDNKFNIGSQ